MSRADGRVVVLERPTTGELDVFTPEAVGLADDGDTCTSLVVGAEYAVLPPELAAEYAAGRVEFDAKETGGFALRFADVEPPATVESRTA